MVDSTRRGLSCDLDNWSLWIQKTLAVTSVKIVQVTEDHAGPTASVWFRISFQDTLGKFHKYHKLDCYSFNFLKLKHQFFNNSCEGGINRFGLLNYCPINEDIK